MFRCKTDDTKSLVEYSTTGICLLVATSRSIFQQKKIGSITLTKQRTRMGGEMKALNIKRREDLNERRGSAYDSVGLGSGTSTENTRAAPPPVA